jgi:hypothetical protein
VGLLLGARGTANLFKQFWAAVFALWDTARAYGAELGARIHEEHERRLAARAESSKIPPERLRAALALHATPIGWTPRGVLASVMLDRLAVFSCMVPALAAVALFHDALGGHASHFAGVLLAVWAVLHVWLSRGRPDVDPTAVMGERARDLAKLFPASFVVMGHTHVPTTKPLDDAIHINLGSWAEEEPSGDEKKPYRAARTHLVIHERDDRHEAHLCEWRSGEGPHTLGSLVRPLRDLQTRARDRDESDDPTPLERSPRAAS